MLNRVTLSTAQHSTAQHSTPYFEKNTTAIIKGVALVMMFVHHFFTFPEWWMDGIDYPILKVLAPYFREPLKICVPIFCFLTGYFYYYNKDKSFLYSARKITDILIDYWCVFFLFAFIAIRTVHYVYTPINFLKEMFALTRPTMKFCWYVYFYYSFMLIFPLIVKALSKNIHFDLFISTLLLPVLLRVVIKIFGIFIVNSTIEQVLNSLALWFPSVLVGFVFAKNELFEKISYYNISSKAIDVFLWIVGLFCVPMGRYFLPSISLNFGILPIVHTKLTVTVLLDFIYAPTFIYCLVNLCRVIELKKTQFVLKQIGKHSLLMWFGSCIFYNNSKSVFQPLLYWPHNPILVLIWGLLICYVFSIALDKGLSIIKNIKNKSVFRTS